MTVAPHQTPGPHPYPNPPQGQQSTYPTAPPWAPPPPAAYPPAGPPPPVYQHGQLLVAYPEAMRDAARPQPPAWWPVVLWTFFFGLLALISVTRRAAQARRGRNSVAPYWVAWGMTTAVASAMSVIVTLTVGVSTYRDWREDRITESVQATIVRDTALRRTTDVTVTSATCTPLADRDTTGLRRYSCALVLDDGRDGTLEVVGDIEGHWEPAN